MSVARSLLRKVKNRLGGGSETPIEAGFIPARGLDYYAFFDALNAAYEFDWYLDVGCWSGDVFGASRSKTIAVDAAFKVEREIIGPKPALFVFQETSDSFFAGGFLARNGIRLSVSFLDGTHLIEYLLRDLANAEANAIKGGVILVHDICPFAYPMATRDQASMEGKPWTGDVWKIVPILQEYRPDLTVTVLDCDPTGLAVISGLDPDNRVLTDRSAEILAKYQALTLDDYTAERFFAGFTYTDARAFAAEGFAPFKAAALR